MNKHHFFAHNDNLVFQSFIVQVRSSEWPPFGHRDLRSLSDTTQIPLTCRKVIITKYIYAF